MADEDDAPPEQGEDAGHGAGGRDDQRGDPASRAIFYVFVAGVSVTLIGAVGMSMQNAVDPTRDSGVPWLGVGAAVLGVLLLGLVIMTRRR